MLVDPLQATAKVIDQCSRGACASSPTSHAPGPVASGPPKPTAAYTGASVAGRRRRPPVVVAGQVVRGRTLQGPTAEHHRFDGFTQGEVSHFRVLLRGLVEDVAYAEFVEHARHKAEVVQHLAAVREVVKHNHLL
jgi:hypothetical protein